MKTSTGLLLAGLVFQVTNALQSARLRRDTIDRRLIVIVEEPGAGIPVASVSKANAAPTAGSIIPTLGSPLKSEATAGSIMPPIQAGNKPGQVMTMMQTNTIMVQPPGSGAAVKTTVTVTVTTTLGVAGVAAASGSGGRNSAGIVASVRPANATVSAAAGQTKSKASPAMAASAAPAAAVNGTNATGLKTANIILMAQPASEATVGVAQPPAPSGPAPAINSATLATAFIVGGPPNMKGVAAATGGTGSVGVGASSPTGVATAPLKGSSASNLGVPGVFQAGGLFCVFIAFAL